jgi:hypothetical protein
LEEAEIYGPGTRLATPPLRKRAALQNLSHGYCRVLAQIVEPNRPDQELPASGDHGAATFPKTTRNKARAANTA